MVVVIGDGFAPGGRVDAARATETAAKSVGLSLIARASLERPDHVDPERWRWEHVLAFGRGSG